MISRKSLLIESILLSLIVLLNVFCLQSMAFKGFIFFDFGGFLDASWRVFLGQVPFVDFIFNTGPVHLYMNSFFFHLFGFSKSAILAHLSVVHGLVIILTYITARKKLPAYWALLPALLSMSCFYWFFAHPWYDHSAFFWGLIGSTLIYTTSQQSSDEDKSYIWLLAGFCSLLSLYTKTNIGAAFIVVQIGLTCLQRQRIKYLFSLALGAFLGIGALFLLHASPMAFFQDALHGYGSVQSGRLQLLKLWQPWLRNYYWILGLTILVHALVARRLFTFNIAFFFGHLFIALFSFITGSLRDPQHIPLMGYLFAISMGIVWADFKQEPKRIFKIFQGLTFTALVIGLCALTVWQARVGFGYEFWTRPTTPPLGTYALKAEPLKGWMIDPETGAVIDKIVDFINESVPAEDSLLILSEFQIVYPLTGRESYRGIPFLWDIGQMPATIAQLKTTHENIVANPPDWILTYREANHPRINPLIEFLRLPDPFLKQYTPVASWGNHGILKRVKPS